MRDEVLELLRKNLIDIALDNHDFEWLKLLTRNNSADYVISPFYQSPFDFLCYDEHFFERRIMGNEHEASLNYRYRESVTHKIYIGEIYIPLNRRATFHSRFRLRHNRSPEDKITEPEWFCSLVRRAQSLL